MNDDVLSKIERVCANRSEAFHMLRIWMICLLGLFAAWAYSHAQWTTPAIFCLMFFVGGWLTGFWFALGLMSKWIDQSRESKWDEVENRLKEFSSLKN